MDEIINEFYKKLNFPSLKKLTSISAIIFFAHPLSLTLELTGCFKPGRDICR